MARPRTDIGTYGKIHTTELGPDLWESRARLRLRNGRLKRFRRRGTTEKAAERALKKAMAELVNEIAGKKISPSTRMTVVMDLWLADVKDKVDRGKRAPSTYYDYRDTVNVHLRPAMGELTCREAENAGLCNETLKDVRKKAAANAKRSKTGTAAMIRARTVLSGICKYAVLHQAMATNPVPSAESIDHDEKVILALEPEQRADFLTKFDAAVAAKVAGKKRIGVRARAWTDLPDLVRVMLATGTRPGEALALTGEGTDLTARKVDVDHHLIRIEGEGVVRTPRRKGRTGSGAAIAVAIPPWALPIVRRRKLESGGGALFPSWNGQWEDVGNVTKRVAEICKEIGYGWVSSRIFRHTVATHLGDSDLTNEAIADQLGNTPDMVRKHYRRPRSANPAIADAMENILGDAGSTSASS